MKLEFHPYETRVSPIWNWSFTHMEPREEADEMTKKRGDADDDISSLWGFSGEVRCSSLCILAFTAS